LIPATRETYTGPSRLTAPQTAMRNRFRLPLTALAAVVLTAAFAAAPPPLAAQAGAHERTVYVSAVDAKGEPVEGLGPDAFVITEDGRKREVLRVSKAVDPMDIALLVDNSAAATAAASDMRQALPNFVATMAPGNQVAVIKLADRPTIAVDYTTDIKKLSDAVKFIPMPSSGMTLLDGVYETSKGLMKRETPRAVIVAVITDGTEFTSRDSKQTAKALVDARAQLHIVGIGRFEHSEEHDLRERSFFIDEGPKASGGQISTILAPNALDKELQRLARELKSQYKVVYGRPESLIPPEKTDIAAAREGITMRGGPSREDKR
jgi:VWFA-related protein